MLLMQAYKKLKMYASIPVMFRVSLSWHKGLAVLLILSLQSARTKSAADFTVVPQMSVVAAGATASFRCRHQNRNTFWLVNGTELVVGNNIPTDVTIRIINNTVNSLNIVGRLEYNGTLIQCGASNTNPLEVTPNITLLVQGPLSQVSNITRILSTISWNQPSSLNLTNIEPNIIYCVEVYNITCSRGSLLVSDCSVTEPRLVDESLQSGYIYNITITPRSNVETASNGTSLTKEENFVFLNEPTITLQYAASSDELRVGINLRLNKTTESIEPTLYILELQSADSIADSRQLQAASSTTTDSSIIALDVSQPLPEKRLWECQVFAFNCDNHPISIPFELSTHEFQNVSVTLLVPGEIAVAGDFIAGSEASGILIITHAINNDSITNYTFIPRSMTGERSVMGLSSNQYSVSVFIVEGNGLPFNRTATRPQVVSVVGTGQNQKSLIDFKLDNISNHVCITCTFLESSATVCVAVVHQRISQLSSSGLMNIESSHKFNRSGDTAYGCIEGVNLTDYQIGVFSLKEVAPTPSTSPGRVIVSVIVTIVVVVLVIIAILLVATMLIVCCKKRMLSLFQSICECTQKKSRVSTLQPLTTDSSTSQTDDEKMYDKLRGPIKKSQVVAEEVHMHIMLGTEEAAAVKEVHGSGPVYSTLGTHPPQSEGGVPSTAIHPPQSVNPPQSGVFYTSVKLGQPSGTMGYDDLHKTMTQYSELQQEPQEEEESFNKGPGNIYAVTRIDTVTNGDVLSDFNDELVYIFNSAQGYVVPSELTSLVEDTDDHDGT